MWHLKCDIRNSQPEATGHEEESHLNCHQHYHTQHPALPSQISVIPTLFMKCLGDLVNSGCWPSYLPFPLFLCPFQLQSPRVVCGETWGCVSQSGAAFHAGSFPCSRSHIGTGWDKWIGAAWWDTASQPGLCPRITSGLLQGVETMAASFRAQLGTQTWPTAPNPPAVPSD